MANDPTIDSKSITYDTLVTSSEDNFKKYMTPKSGFIITILRIPKFETCCKKIFCNVVRLFLPSLDQNHFEYFDCGRSRFL